jgi:hypothetical protein
MHSPALLCPNCSAPLSVAPRTPCRRCGYEAALAREFLWLYLGGGGVIILGLALGIAGVLVEGAGPEHWSRAWRGWFPLGPWPSSHHWLAFLVEGIALTLAGLGLTRQQRSAAWLLSILALGEAGWLASRLILAGRMGAAPPLGSLLLLLAIEAGVVLLSVRLALALRRTPGRDVRKLQATLGAPQDGAEPAPGAESRLEAGSEELELRREMR